MWRTGAAAGLRLFQPRLTALGHARVLDPLAARRAWRGGQTPINYFFFFFVFFSSQPSASVTASTSASAVSLQPAFLHSSDYVNRLSFSPLHATRLRTLYSALRLELRSAPIVANHGYSSTASLPSSPRQHTGTIITSPPNFVTAVCWP